MERDVSISIKNFNLYRGKKCILQNVNYTFNNKTIYNIYGENGSGKSSFAKALSGYIKYSGTSEFVNYKVGVVGSYTNVPDEVSVKDIVKFLKKQSNMSPEFQQRLYKLCDIDNFIDRKKVSNLSDGQKKKLIIYSTLNCKKEVLILDEFLVNLDRKSRVNMRDFINKIHTELNLVCINISHSIEDVKHYGGEILYLDDSSKNLLEVSSLETLEKYI